jgi:hypothetical protein
MNEMPSFYTVEHPKVPKLGAIRTGAKTEKGYPTKLDHFLITEPQLDSKGNSIISTYWHGPELYGSSPKELKVFVTSDTLVGTTDPVCMIYRARYGGSKLNCANFSGPGFPATAFSYSTTSLVPEKKEIECDPEVCPYAKSDKCQIRGVFKFGLMHPKRTEYEIGGHYWYVTSSWSTIATLIGSLTEVQRLLGKITMTPLILRLKEESVEFIDKKGARQTSKFWSPYVVAAITREDINPKVSLALMDSTSGSDPDVLNLSPAAKSTMVIEERSEIAMSVATDADESPF